MLDFYVEASIDLALKRARCRFPYIRGVYSSLKTPLGSDGTAWMRK